MKNILITGGSCGLGLELIRKFLKEDWCVYTVSRSMSLELEDLLGKNKNLHYRAFDLEKVEDVKESIFNNFVGFNVPLSAVVHNAAIAYDDIITNANYDKLLQMYKINVFSPIMITKFSIRNMLFNNLVGSSIVFISSISTATGYKGLSMYASTKGSLEAQTKNLAREWGGRGIRFNTVVPGFMETKMSQGLSEDQKNRIYNRTSLKKPTEISSVANTAFFLCSEEASSITGQKIYVDSGSI